MNSVQRGASPGGRRYPKFTMRSPLLPALLLLSACSGSPAPSPGAAPPLAGAPSPVSPAEPAPADGVVDPTAAPAVAEPSPDAPVSAAAPPTAPGSPPTPDAAPTPVSTPTAVPPRAAGTTPPPAAATSASPEGTPADPAPAAAAPVATAADYTLTPAKSSIYVQVFKETDTLAANLSHDHVIVATGWSGTVHWDPADPTACVVKINVPVSGLVNDEESMRKRVGYDTVLDAGDRAEVRANMVSKGQLDANAFPNITFRSTGCAASGDKVKVTGDLSIHGVPKRISPSFTIAGDGKSLSASGGFTASASDFGFAPFTALLGALKNKDAMKFTVSVVGAAG